MAIKPEVDAAVEAESDKSTVAVGWRCDVTKSPPRARVRSDLGFDYEYNITGAEARDPDTVFIVHLDEVILETKKRHKEKNSNESSNSNSNGAGASLRSDNSGGKGNRG